MCCCGLNSNTDLNVKFDILTTFFSLSKMDLHIITEIIMLSNKLTKITISR